MSLRLDPSTVIVIKMPGMKQEMWTDYSLAVQRPNRFALVLKEGMMGATKVSDGAKFYTYVPAAKTYSEEDAPPIWARSATPANGMDMMGPMGAADAALFLGSFFAGSP